MGGASGFGQGFTGAGASGSGYNDLMSAFGMAPGAAPLATQNVTPPQQAAGSTYAGPPAATGSVTSSTPNAEANALFNPSMVNNLAPTVPGTDIVGGVPSWLTAASSGGAWTEPGAPANPQPVAAGAPVQTNSLTRLPKTVTPKAAPGAPGAAAAAPPPAGYSWQPRYGPAPTVQGMEASYLEQLPDAAFEGLIDGRMVFGGGNNKPGLMDYARWRLGESKFGQLHTQKQMTAADTARRQLEYIR